MVFFIPRVEDFAELVRLTSELLSYFMSYFRGVAGFDLCSRLLIMFDVFILLMFFFVLSFTTTESTPIA